MKKINLKIKSGGKFKRTIVLSVLVIFLLVVVNFTGFSESIKNFFFSFSSPTQRVLWQAGENFSDFYARLFKESSLEKDREAFLRENRELINKLFSLRQLEEENKVLREALEIGLPDDFKLVFAQVISHDVFHDSVLINKGKKDGVYQGSPVITKEKVLLGRIGQVYDNYSEVVLIADKESSFDAEVIMREDDSEKIYGVVKGRGEQAVELDLVPKEKTLSRESKVVTSSLGGVFPPGLLVGEIEEINQNDVDPFQTAKIEPAFRMKDLDYLFIITEW